VVPVGSGRFETPVDEAGLRVIPLYTEPLVAVLPAGHRLAGKDQVTEADLAGEPLLWQAGTSTQPTRRPHPNAGYQVRGVDETLEHVAAGRGISFLARSATVASLMVDHFLTAAQETAEITAECGNYEMWQLGSGGAAKHG
jgi:DNA-binding transcriptional LysR family regulator